MEALDLTNPIPPANPSRHLCTSAQPVHAPQPPADAPAAGKLGPGHPSIFLFQPIHHPLGLSTQGSTRSPGNPSPCGRELPPASIPAGPRRTLRRPHPPRSARPARPGRDREQPWLWPAHCRHPDAVAPTSRDSSDPPHTVAAAPVAAGLCSVLWGHPERARAKLGPALPPCAAAALRRVRRLPLDLPQQDAVVLSSSGRRRVTADTWNPRASAGLIYSAATPATSRRRPAVAPDPTDRPHPPTAVAPAVRLPAANPGSTAQVRLHFNSCALFWGSGRFSGDPKALR
ncbi:nascent polypeptide-associated complex subunit alpha, muscle-specific form-like [Ananas comosus]|uniref:Nascent polypeptide-associated complex subunit alpha, muscle-specific form-like n=1 Tax=Ananas comosus TaxID=4615 RepID=A0A6P5GQX7_ANACO|nr:nascent polypeptide-associated complex subunit alpha, muscle-specific form-like [Ananas comosus]